MSKSGLSRNKASSSQGVLKANEKSPLLADESNLQQGGMLKNEKSKATRRDPRKIFVGGLPGSVLDDEFRQFFTQFGTVVDSVVIFDTNTRRSRGFGFVTFEDKATAERVLGENQFGSVVIRGKMCEIKPAEPKVHSHSKASRYTKQDLREQSSLSSYPAEVPPATVSSTSETLSLSHLDSFDPYIPQTAVVSPIPYMTYPVEAPQYFQQHSIPMQPASYQIMHHQVPFQPQVFAYNNSFPYNYPVPFYHAVPQEYVTSLNTASAANNLGATFEQDEAHMNNEESIKSDGNKEISLAKR